MTPNEAIDHAAEALNLARHDGTAEALDALHRALLALAGAYEVASPTDPRTLATRAALDAAVAVRVAPHLAPLDAAAHAVFMARAALEGGTA